MEVGRGGEGEDGDEGGVIREERGRGGSGDQRGDFVYWVMAPPAF